MKALFASAVASAAVVAAVSAFSASSASAAVRPAWDGASGAVFALTDNTAGNAVVVYHRSADGTLTPAGTYSTHGLGGILANSVVDHTASQGALTYDRAHGLLIAVNPGSDTIAVFRAQGDQLSFVQTLSSGGDFPVSVAVHGDRVYVLNAWGGGSLSGFKIDGGWLTPIPGSYRALGLGTTSASDFHTTPGQVAFSPDGGHLLVTTKATGSAVDVFAVKAGGLLSAAPVVNSLPGAVPFDLTFDWADHVVLTEAGPNAIATFTLSPSGHLGLLASADTGQMATCWVVRDGKHFYVSNAGSATVSGYDVGSSGGLTALGNTTTGGGTVDAAAALDRFLYVQTGAAGVVDEFAIGHGGSLRSLGSVTVPGGAGGEGIAAS